ncbi:MAG TPA: Scr1 family TA system antitoxin-like transcriptional regulator [Gordonia sp. (in: high G+C Gram-positive bacteria)]|nr:Scr1 family TA system antitoxin-like transcriptional regulator [Gordonia sp. (in: high G+C Gram-positive bacteria)]
MIRVNPGDLDALEAEPELAFLRWPIHAPPYADFIVRLVDARAVTHRSTARLHRRDSERDYAHAILHACTAITGGRDDLDEAVHMRIVRQLVLQRGGHRFHILIGEAALHRTVGDGAVMAFPIFKIIL